MNYLNTDVLSTIKSFIGDESYISFSFNKYFESQWDKPKKTRAITKFTSNNMLTMSCLLYTSPSPRDRQKSRMPSSA